MVITILNLLLGNKPHSQVVELPDILKFWVQVYQI